MNYHNAEFVLSAVSEKQFLYDLPEIVFCGKSNVGKSTLLNRLLGRRALARTSSKPGKTAQINYFRIDNTCYFVDLPGYGYAKVSDAQLKKWAGYIERYFVNNDNKALVVLLTDMRHPPTKQDQQMFYTIAEKEIPYIVVGTKLDKLNRADAEKMKAYYMDWCDENGTYFIPFSSITDVGKDDIIDCIEQALEQRRI